MSKFFVGQRVRLVRAANRVEADYIGEEATIIEFGDWKKGTIIRSAKTFRPGFLGSDCDVEIVLDCLGFGILVHTSQLEPILDDKVDIEKLMGEPIDFSEEDEEEILQAV